MWTGVVVIGLATGQAQGDTLQPNLPANAFDANGKFLLANLDAPTLQAMLNAMNPDCGPDGKVSCTWQVLSLNHVPLNTPAQPKLVLPTPQAPLVLPGTGKRFSNDVPPGFEKLAMRASEDVSLFHKDVNVLSANIVIDNDSYSFSDPLLVAFELSQLKIAKRSTLEYFLSNEFPLDDAGICVLNHRAQNCETKSPIELAILPKLDENRLDVLVGRSLSAQSDFATRFLPNSSSGLSTRAGFRTTYASVGGSLNTVDTHVDAAVSYGDGGLFAKNSFSDQDLSDNVSELFFAHQFQQHQLKIGTIDFESTDFLLNNELIGIDWSTSFNRYTNLRELYSTPVLVTLSNPAVVQILVNGTLYSSASLPPGNHRLNTKNLPNGTYEVDIRIQDANNGIQTRSQIFSKRLTLPPPGQLVYGFSAGKPRADENNTLQTTNASVIKGAVSKRLSPTFGVDIELASFLNEQTAQARLSRIGTRFELSLGALVGTQSSFGSSLRAAYSNRNFQLTFQGAKFSSDHDVQNNQQLAQFVRDDYFSRSISATYSSGKYRFGVLAERLNRDTNLGVTERDRIVARVRRRISVGAPGSAISASYSSVDEKQELQLKLDIVLDDPNINQRTSFELLKSGNSALEPAVSYQANYNPAKGFTPLGSADASLSFRSRLSENNSFVGGGLKLTDQFYDLGVGVDLFDDSTEGDVQHRTIASLGSQIAASKGKVAFGRNTGQSSGIIIDVTGQPEGRTYDVKVNGSQRGVGHVGSKFFLPLQPFRQHRIDLLPHSISLGNFESASRTITLYPGNVAVMEIAVQSTYVLITRFNDSAGELISDKVIRYQGLPYFINDEGVVQLEVVAGDKLDIELDDGESCSAEMPDPMGKEILIESVPIICL